MKKLLLILCCFPLLMAATCEDEDDIQIADCTSDIVSGLNVKIRDAATGAFLSDGVTITAQDAGYSEVLELIPGNEPAVFEGAYERTGTYVFTVEKDGYQTLVTDGFVVNRNACHVITQNLTLDLAPN